MAIVHVKLFVKASSVTSFWMSAVLEPPQHRDVVEMALCEVAGFGILVDAPRYDHDTDTFFVQVDQPSNRAENRLETALSLINHEIRKAVTAAGSQPAPDHHSDREAHADLG